MTQVSYTNVEPQYEVQARVSRSLPPPNTDSQAIDVSGRLGRYGDLKVETLAYWRHLLADEGSWFTVNDAQNGRVDGVTETAFSDIAANFMLINRDQPQGKRIYVDLVKLVCAATGANGVGLQCAVQLDNYPSRLIGATLGGTDLTANIVSPNSDLAVKSVGEAHAGILVPNAKSSFNRVVEGLIYLKNAILVIGDTFNLICGSQGGKVSTTLQNAITFANVGINPVIIGPQQCMLVHIWMPSQSTTASQFTWNANWFEK